jgi:Bacterial Ig-like domain (group 3)/FG-GAP-like repeat
MWKSHLPPAFRQHLGCRLLLPAMLAISLHHVAQAAAVLTTTTLTLSSASVAAPAAVTLTASVVGGGAAITTGAVTFCDASAAECQNSSIVGTAQLNGSTAVLKIVPSIGVHTYLAKFNATTAAAASTSTVQTLTVTGKDPTSTTLAVSGNPSGYTLTATVAGMAGHPPLLSGTVSFQDTTDGNYVLGTGALGTPTFTQRFTQPNPPINTGNEPAAAGVGDFNGDGKPDLAVMNADDNAIAILLGNGDGTFTNSGSITGVGTTSCSSNNQQSNCSIAVGDFNHDGKADLVETSDFDNAVYIYLGNGDGTFTAAPGSPVTVGNFPVAVRTGDFNTDGLLDLVVANAGDDTVSILLGNGDGTFAEASGSPVAVGSFPFFLAVADFNGDGRVDVAVTNDDDSTVSVLLSNGDGTFFNAPGSPVGSGNYAPCPIVAADFNGDGIVDLAVANFTPDTGQTVSNVVILLGKGDGSFTDAPGSPVLVGLNPFAMVAADFNQDGNTDLAVDNYGEISDPTTQSLTLLLGDGKGGFSVAGAATQLGDSPQDLAPGDFNGDGTIDLAVPNLADFTTSILLNILTQTETASVSNITIAGSGTHYADAVYQGSTYFAPSTSNKVPLLGKTVATTLTLIASPAEQLSTMSVTFTAQLATTANPPPSNSPTGSVTFLDGTTVLGTASLSGTGQVVYATSSLTDGKHSITATYGGDPSYLATTSNAVSVQIDDLAVTRLDKISPIVVPGTAVTYSLQAAPQVASTFLYNASFTASGLPVGATATFSPTAISAGASTAKFTVTINTAAPTATGQVLAFGLLLPLLAAVRFRRRLRLGMLPVLLLAFLSLSAVAGLSGCSGSGLFAAKKYNYTIIVTATEGSLQRSSEVPLAIQ